MLYQARCVYFVTLVLCQTAKVFVVTSKSVPFFSSRNTHRRSSLDAIIPAIATSIVCAVAVTEIPQAQRLFNTRTVPSPYWMYAFLCSRVLFVILESRKLIR